MRVQVRGRSKRRAWSTTAAPCHCREDKRARRSTLTRVIYGEGTRAIITRRRSLKVTLSSEGAVHAERELGSAGRDREGRGRRGSFYCVYTCLPTPTTQQQPPRPGYNRSWPRSRIESAALPGVLELTKALVPRLLFRSFFFCFIFIFFFNLCSTCSSHKYTDELVWMTHRARFALQEPKRDLRDFAQ